MAKHTKLSRNRSSCLLVYSSTVKAGKKIFATEIEWFASDSAKDSGTSSLGGAISRNHLVYEPEKTHRKDRKCRFLRCSSNC